MPYNSSAISPDDEVTGTTSLPLSRVKRTIAADEDIGAVSAQAAFLITKATELFIQYAAQRSYDMARTDPKPKRSLTYSHVVARTDNLEFLSDIVPQTTTLRAHRERKARESAVATDSIARKLQGPSDHRQTTINGQAVPHHPSYPNTTWQDTSLLSTSSRVNDPMHEPGATNGTTPVGESSMSLQQLAPNPANLPQDQDRDVEMS